jgi:AcrR family transcriptional regulator
MEKDMDEQGTREQLLDAGLAILLEEPTDIALRASRIARRADVTSGAFFHYWQTQGDFLADLLDYSLVGERLYAHTFDAVTEVLQPLLEGENSLETRERAIREAGQKSLEALTQSPAFAVQMALWSRHLHDDKVKDRLNYLYRDLDSRFVRFFGKLLDEWRLEPREPYTLERIAAVLSALANGLAIRRAVDSETLPDEHRFFGSLVLSLLPTMTKSIDRGDNSPT